MADDMPNIPNFLPCENSAESQCSLLLAQAEEHQAKVRELPTGDSARDTHFGQAQKLRRMALQFAYEGDLLNKCMRSELLHELGDACIYLALFEEARDYLMQEGTLLKQTLDPIQLPAPGMPTNVQRSPIEYLEWARHSRSLSVAMLALGDPRIEYAIHHYTNSILLLEVVYNGEDTPDKVRNCLLAFGALLSLQGYCKRASDDLEMRSDLVRAHLHEILS